MDHKIPFNKPFIVGKELDYITQAVSINSHISGDGKFTRLCHEWFKKYLNCHYSVLTHSCTAALEMAAILCDIKPGDEIIMPSFTFVSTANAFVLRGGVPVFVDIRPDTLNIDEHLIEEAITPKTRAIVPVHYAGVPCEMGHIMDIAGRHDLYVIEDAAQALFSQYKARYLGTIGDFGCLSFHETKNIISGEGGALLINNDRFMKRAEIIREKGTNRSQFFRGEVDKYTWIDIGSSFLPSDMIAAFLFAQLEQADKIIEARRRIFRIYYDNLKDLEDKGYIRRPYMDEHCSCNGHIFYIITGGLEERSRLISFLKSRNIFSVFHYVPLHSSPAGIKYGRSFGDLKITDEISDRVLRLPLYFEMKDDDIQHVVDTVASFYEKTST